MTTEEYIRSPLFEVICCGIKLNDGPTVVVHHEEVEATLVGMGIEQSVLVCHHTAFDGSILQHHYGLVPRVYCDTLSMSRPANSLVRSCSLASLVEHYGIGKKGYEVVGALGKRLKDFQPWELDAYKAYCANDVELTYKLFQLLLQELPKSELRAIDLHLRCYCDPKIVLDTPLLQQYKEEITLRKEFLLDTLGVTEKDLRSDQKLAALLEEQGIDPPTKINKNGDIKYAFAKTDEEFRDLEEHPNETVGALVRARLGVKTSIEESRCDRLLGISLRGKMPIPMSYYGAHTGRPSGWDKINPMNLKKKSRIRYAMQAPSGYVICDSDSSQIECRLNAYFSGQEDLVQAFREKRDVYSEFASDLFHRIITKKNEDERFIGKQSELGFGYGMGADKYKKTVETLSMVMLGRKIEVSHRTAEEAKDLYRRKRTAIKRMWKICEEALFAIATGVPMEFGHGVRVTATAEGILKPNGMYIRYPELRQEDGEWKYSVKKGRLKSDRKIYGGKVLENIIQSLAFDIIKFQWALIAKRYDVVISVYDALGALIPIVEQEEGMEYVQECMRTLPSWAAGLPIDCEASCGVNYGEC